MADFNVFKMGVSGVNLVKSPLELALDELTNAQNAEPFREQGLAGIRKRQGLQRVVPTGTVAPGALDGPAGLLEVIDEGGFDDGPFIYDSRWSAHDDKKIWTPFSNPTGFAPNTVYNLGFGATYDVNLTPLLPAVWIENIWYFGGHESGQVLAFDRVRDVRRGLAFDGDVRIREAVRLSATGATDDCYPLPGVFLKFSDQALVVSIAGGGVQLYYPSTGVVKKLPTLAATATGSASFAGRLWVVSGLSLYSIDPDNDSAWTLSATVADAGIAALTGLAFHNGALYAGSRTNAIQPVRCYKFVPSYDTWLSVATTSASVAQLVTPAYMYGPFPQVSGLRVHVIYSGSADVFVTLQGSLGNAEGMTGVSWRILTLDTGTAGPWHNGADTATDNIINTWWAGSSDRQVGPIVNIAGRENIHYTHYRLAGDFLMLGFTDPLISRPNWGGSAGGSDVSASEATFFKWPLML